MPAFNASAYIAQAIESVLAQSFRDWELLIVDDGSSDGTLSIARQFADKHPERIRVFVQPNRGASAARNVAIRSAKGTHIAFLDSDDLWTPDKLALQTHASNDPGVAFTYTGYDLIGESGELIRQVMPDPSFQGDIYRRLWLEENEIIGATMLIRKSLLFEVGLFDERLRGAENLDLRLRLARRGPVTFLSRALYRYRKHSASLTMQSQMMDEQHARLLAAHFTDPLTHEQTRLFKAVKARSHYHHGNQAFSEERHREALNEYLRAFGQSSRKLDVSVRIFRCLLGKRLNSGLRQLAGKRGGPERTSMIPASSAQRPGASAPVKPRTYKTVVASGVPEMIPNGFADLVSPSESPLWLTRWLRSEEDPTSTPESNSTQRSPRPRSTRLLPGQVERYRPTTPECSVK